MEFCRGFMKISLLILCSLIFSVVVTDSVVAADAGPGRHQNAECCQTTGNGQCNPEKRGWCGKRKGDWYGARRPVTSINDAREQLAKYFSGQQLVVAEVAEKQWRFEADVLDSCGKVVDRVMIDKRSGRVRSIY
jgi:hypothetical protein